MTSRRRSHPSQDIPSDLLLNLHQQLARLEAMSLGNRQAMTEATASVKELMDHRFRWLKETIDHRLTEGDRRMGQTEKEVRMLGARLGKLERAPRPGATGAGATGTDRWGTLKAMAAIGSGIASLAKLPLPWNSLALWAAGISASAYLMPKWVATWAGAALLAWGQGGG